MAYHSEGAGKRNATDERRLLPESASILSSSFSRCYALATVGRAPALVARCPLSDPTPTNNKTRKTTDGPRPPESVEAQNYPGPSAACYICELILRTVMVHKANRPSLLDAASPLRNADDYLLLMPYLGGEATRRYK